MVHILLLTLGLAEHTLEATGTMSHRFINCKNCDTSCNVLNDVHEFPSVV